MILAEFSQCIYSFIFVWFADGMWRTWWVIPDDGGVNVWFCCWWWWCMMMTTKMMIILDTELTSMLSLYIDIARCPQQWVLKGIYKLASNSWVNSLMIHDDVNKWKHFPRHWPFARGIHRSPVNSPHKCQWRSALMFVLICVWINGWVNNREAGDLRCHRAHYDVRVMWH